MVLFFNFLVIRIITPSIDILIGIVDLCDPNQ